MKPLVKNLSDQHGSYLVKKLQAACRMWLERQTGIPQRILGAPDVLRTAEMRARMGAAGRELMTERWTWPSLVERLVAAIDER